VDERGDGGEGGGVAQRVEFEDGVDVVGEDAGEEERADGQQRHDHAGDPSVWAPQLCEHAHDEGREQEPVGDVMGAVRRLPEVGHAEVDDVEGDQPDEPGHDEGRERVEGEYR
jgi:hypothetical protein